MQESYPMKQFYVYIITNKPNGVLYTGLTNNLERRILEHKNKQIDGFSAKYNLSKLVYYEEFDNHHLAFEKERRMKKWKREYKLNLINQMNPNWIDLAADWI